MLKLFPPFREQDERLLICATNSVRALDSAFLRHGRFDYIIPVGPPDAAAREAIWDRYLAAMPHGELDMAAIVEESRLFTRADIEFAARRTAQLVFERVMFEHGSGRSRHGRHRAGHRPDPAHPHPRTGVRVRTGHQGLRKGMSGAGTARYHGLADVVTLAAPFGQVLANALAGSGRWAAGRTGRHALGRSYGSVRSAGGRRAVAWAA